MQYDKRFQTVIFVDGQPVHRRQSDTENMASVIAHNLMKSELDKRTEFTAPPCSIQVWDTHQERFANVCRYSMWVDEYGTVSVGVDRRRSRRGGASA